MNFNYIFEIQLKDIVLAKGTSSAIEYFGSEDGKMPISHTPISDNDRIIEKNNKKNTIPFKVTAPKYSIEEVILPDSIKEELSNVMSLAQNNNLIFNEWGLGRVIKHHNLCVNLYGPSGTGKTMTAHGIAKNLNKNLVVANYAELESKYVGETSKNLVALFEFATENDVIILFDEADAMLSKRVTSMQSAADVSVNQTRNTILKLLDEYKGIVIFTTNFIHNFDTAFFRRISTHIKFELPDEAARTQIWKYYLVPQLPIENRLDVIEKLSKIDGLTGADISTIVLKTAIRAANRKQNIVYEDFLNYVSKVNETKRDIESSYEITTRDVSEEYALKQIKKGEKDGI